MTQQSGMTTPNAASTMTGQSSPYFGQSHHGSLSSLGLFAPMYIVFAQPSQALTVNDTYISWIWFSSAHNEQAGNAVVQNKHQGGY